VQCSAQEKTNDESRSIVTVVSLWNCNSIFLIIHNNYAGGMRRISWSEGYKFCLRSQTLPVYLAAINYRSWRDF